MNALCKNRSFNRTYGVIVLVIGLALMVGFPLWSQAAEQSEFVSELLDILEGEYGWTAQEVRALDTQNVDWEKAEGADPEVVAMALQFANSEDGGMEPMAQALLAINLAQEAIGSEAVGIDELTIARAALEGVQDILTEIQAFRLGDGDRTVEQLGKIIRDKIHERISVAARVHARDLISKHVRKAQESRPEFLVLDIPPVPGDWPSGRF